MPNPAVHKGARDCQKSRRTEEARESRISRRRLQSRRSLARSLDVLGLDLLLATSRSPKRSRNRTQFNSRTGQYYFRKFVIFSHKLKPPAVRSPAGRSRSTRFRAKSQLLRLATRPAAKQQGTLPLTVSFSDILTSRELWLLYRSVFSCGAERDASCFRYRAHFRSARQA